MIEVFDSFEIKFICSPIILVCPNDPIGRIRVITILIFQMILAYYNDKWRYRLIIRIDALDYSDPFPIIKLYGFNFLIPVVQYHNKSGCNLAYKKACFIEVSNVGFYVYRVLVVVWRSWKSNAVRRMLYRVSLTIGWLYLLHCVSEEEIFASPDQILLVRLSLFLAQSIFVN